MPNCEIQKSTKNKNNKLLFYDQFLLLFSFFPAKNIWKKLPVKQI